MCQGNLKNEADVREMLGKFEILSGKFALGCLNSVFKGQGSF